jgi:hypothetical protein
MLGLKVEMSIEIDIFESTVSKIVKTIVRIWCKTVNIQHRPMCVLVRERNKSSTTSAAVRREKLIVQFNSL